VNPATLPIRPLRPLRVLFDITHPADVHLFKAVISRLRAEGNAVLVACRDKDVTVDLLKREKIDHLCLSRMGRGLLGLGKELLVRDVRMLRATLRFRPDVMVARGGIFIGPVGWLLRVPRLVVEDTEHAKFERMLSLPFATYICTGTGYMGDHGRRQVRFRGVPQFAYTDPRYFQPDPRPLWEAGIDTQKPYIVLRTVSWGAAHDLGFAGAHESAVMQAVERLSRFGRVLISSEKPLPAPLEGYRNPVPSNHMLDLLSFATLFIGEGGTMAAEAGLMGVPAIFTNPLSVGFLLAMERDYQLVRNVRAFEDGLPIAEQWLIQPDLKDTWQQRRRRLLEDSEDIPAFLYGMIQRAVADR
jgi:uncharacterized protein